MEADIRSITGKIRAACQLTEGEMEILRRTLEALAHPAIE